MNALAHKHDGMMPLLLRSLVMVFLLALIAGSVAFYMFSRANFLSQIKGKAEALLSAAIAVRTYTVEELSDELRKNMDVSFYPQSVPSYSAKVVFRNLAADFPEYIYREAALNPTNPEDRATGFETEFINTFRKSPETEEISGIRRIGNERVYVVARPIRVTSEACLMCHSTPEIAPASMIAKYGNANGFGWTLGEVIGVQMLTIPVADELTTIIELVAIFVAILLVVFIIVFCVVALPLRRQVVLPLRKLSQSAERASLRETTDDLPADGTSELRNLAKSINRLRTSMKLTLHPRNDRGT